MTNCNMPNKESVRKRNYKTITTYLQVGSSPKYKYMVETLDSTGKKLECINYSEKTGLIFYIDKYYYDSLQRKVFITGTRFSPDPNLIYFVPEISTHQYFYNSDGYISKSIWTTGKYSVTVFFEYFPTGKIKQSKTVSEYDFMGNYIDKFFYKKNDSLVKKEHLNFSYRKKCFNERDSITYTDTSKIVFKVGFDNEITSIVQTNYKNNKIAKQIEYETTISKSKRKEFYIYRETSFTYNNNILAIKVIKRMKLTDSMGTFPEEIETYTYLYE